jgi:hypothetical protein
MAQSAVDKIQNIATSASGIAQIASGDKSIKVEHSVDNTVRNIILLLIFGIVVSILLIKFL